MADFNATLNPYQSSDFTGASRGYEDNALGSLFTNISQGFETAVKATDAFITRRMEDSARSMVEPLRDAAIADVAGINVGGAMSYTDENGNTAATPGSGNVSTPDTGLPQEATSQFSRLALVKQGVKAGRLSDSYYRSQLDVVSKKLRRMYPGYEDEIDDRMQALTGSIPANKLLADLQAEANAAMSSGSSTANKALTLYNKGIEDGAWGANPPTFASFNNSYDAVAQSISGFYVDKADRQRRMDKLNLADKDTDVAKKLARTNLEEDLTSTRVKMLADTTSKFGKSWTEIQDKIDKLQATYGDKPWPPNEQAELEIARQQANAALRRELVAQASRTLNDKGDTYTGYGITTKDINEAIDNQIAQNDLFFFGLNTKDRGILDHQNALSQAYKEGNTAIYMSDKSTSRLITMNQLLGPQFVAGWMSRGTNSKMLDHVSQLVRDDVITGIAVGEYESVDAAIQAVKDKTNGMSDEQRQSLGDNIIGTLQKNVLDENQSLELRARAAGALYGPQNDGYAVKTPKAFNPMANPQTLKATYELSQKTGRPEIWNNAKRWVLGTGTTLTRNFAIKMSSSALEAGGQISFDPETHMFSYHQPIGRPTTGGGRAAQSTYQDGQAVDTAVKQVNRLVQGMIPAFMIDNPKTSSEDINTWIKGMTDAFGTGLSVPLFKSLGQQVPVQAPAGMFSFDQNGRIQLTVQRPAGGGPIQARPTPGSAVAAPAIPNPEKPATTPPVEPEASLTGGPDFVPVQPVGTEGADFTPPNVEGTSDGFAPVQPIGSEMRLGGPQMAAGGDLPQVPTAYGTNPTEYRTALLADIKDLNTLYHSTDDPTLKASYLAELQANMKAYQGLRGGQLPLE